MSNDQRPLGEQWNDLPTPGKVAMFGLLVVLPIVLAVTVGGSAGPSTQESTPQATYQPTYELSCGEVMSQYVASYYDANGLYPSATEQTEYRISRTECTGK